MTKHYAVVGNPIAHSRSPQLHHAFAKAAQVELDYQKILVPLDGFAPAVQQFFAQGGSGLNVTVPFKQQAFALCDQLTNRAQAAGAVNTLWQCNAQLHGDNTDGQGLVDALNTLGWNLANANLIILGAGGATRGVILPLAQAGVASICIANRTVSRAQQLVEQLQPWVGSTRLVAATLDALSGTYDIAINATSASLSGEALPLTDDLQFHHAYEMAYGQPSDFMQLAISRGLPCADGYSMLVGQAIAAFYVWHGIALNLADFLPARAVTPRLA